MRAPVDHISAPPFPPRLRWLGGRPEGFPMLLEFWDFCRVQSLRTLPYMRAWRERYPDLTVVGVHTPGFPPSHDADAVRDAVARLAVPYPVAIDTDFEVWDLYGNLGWPARYLFDDRGMLLHYHYGEGGYDETELAIQELVSSDQPVLASFRPEEAAGALLEAQTDDVGGPYSGRYTAGGVWAVLSGTGSLRVNGRTLAVDHPGAYELIAHDHSTTGELSLEIGAGVTCHAVCFTPGLTG